MASVDKAVEVVIIICSTFFDDISCFFPSFFKQKHSPTLLNYTPSKLTINFIIYTTFFTVPNPIEILFPIARLSGISKLV